LNWAPRSVRLLPTFRYRDSIPGAPHTGFRGCTTTRKTDLLKGTLDLLILRTLDLQPLHGVGIAERIRQVTDGTFVVQAGSLFPALHRLELEGWIAGDWHVNEQGRRVKSYRLTAAGRRQLTAERRLWERIVAAVGQVLEGA
jgi:transcriptional regulator